MKINIRGPSAFNTGLSYFKILKFHFMKVRYYLIFLLLAGFAMTISNCKKSPVIVDQLSLLPPATDTGANTFGCLIDGVAMLPKSGVPTWGNPAGPPLHVEFRSQVRINVGQSIDATHAISMTFYLYNLYATGAASYNWGQTQFGTESFPLYNNGLWGDFLTQKTNLWVRCGSYQGSGTTVVSKFDTTKHILSGTFSGKLAPKLLGGDTINISNGRFDVRW